MPREFRELFDEHIDNNQVRQAIANAFDPAIDQIEQFEYPEGRGGDWRGLNRRRQRNLPNWLEYRIADARRELQHYNWDHGNVERPPIYNEEEPDEFENYQYRANRPGAGSVPINPTAGPIESAANSAAERLEGEHPNMAKQIAGGLTRWVGRVAQGLSNLAPAVTQGIRRYNQAADAIADAITRPLTSTQEEALQNIFNDMSRGIIPRNGMVNSAQIQRWHKLANKVRSPAQIRRWNQLTFKGFDRL